MELEKILNKHLSESALTRDPDNINELLDINYDDTNDVSSLSTGLRRIAINLKRANTPKKYAICFRMVADLVEKFPMKSLMIWKAVADAYNSRYAPEV